MTLQEYITAIRGNLRIADTIAITDEEITRKINEAFNVVFSYVPYRFSSIYLDATSRQREYVLTNKILKLVSVSVYSLFGTSLSQDITGSATSITVTDAAGINQGDRLIIGETPLVEIVLVNSKTDNTLTVSRGQNGTVAQNWSSGTPIRVWNQTAKWLKLQSTTVLGSQETTDVFVEEPAKEPKYYALNGDRLFIHPAPIYSCYRGIRLFAYEYPNILSGVSDVPIGFPTVFDPLIIGYVTAHVLINLGGEDALNKAGAYLKQFSEGIVAFEKTLRKTAEYLNLDVVPIIGR